MKKDVCTPANRPPATAALSPRPVAAATGRPRAQTGERESHAEDQSARDLCDKIRVGDVEEGEVHQDNQEQALRAHIERTVAELGDNTDGEALFRGSVRATFEVFEADRCRHEQIRQRHDRFTIGATAYAAANVLTMNAQLPTLRSAPPVSASPLVRLARGRRRVHRAAGPAVARRDPADMPAPRSTSWRSRPAIAADTNPPTHMPAISEGQRAAGRRDSRGMSEIGRPPRRARRPPRSPRRRSERRRRRGRARSARTRPATLAEPHRDMGPSKPFVGGLRGYGT